MPPTDAQRVRHTLDAIGKIEVRLAGLDQAAFVADEVVHDSVPQAE